MIFCITHDDTIFAVKGGEQQAQYLASQYTNHVYFFADLAEHVEKLPDDHPTLFASFVDG